MLCEKAYTLLQMGLGDLIQKLILTGTQDMQSEGICKTLNDNITEERIVL